MAFVEEELQDNTQYVDHHLWMEAVLGLRNVDIDSWKYIIRERDWFRNPDIQKSLRRYCEASSELERYGPFCKTVNKVLELAKADLFPKDYSYPISDITFVRNDPVCLRRNNLQLDALRKLGVLGTRQQYAVDLQWPLDAGPRLGLHGTAMLVFVDFKLRLRKLYPDRDLGTTPDPGKKRPHEKTDDDNDDSPRIAKSHDTDSGAWEAGDTSNSQYQEVSYASEVLSSTHGTRIHSLGMTAVDDRITTSYYDASGIVRSDRSVSIVDDFEEFAALFVGLAACDVHQWGAFPAVFQPPKNTPYPGSFPPRDLRGYSIASQTGDGKQVNVTLSNPVGSQYNIVGGSTFAYKAATDLKLSHGRAVIAKFSQPVRTRKSEAAFLEIARNANVSHLPELHFSADLWNLSDGVRGALFPAGSDLYDDRVLRMMVYTQYQPLQALFSTSAEHLLTMIDQMLDCLHELKFKAGILHCDVSHDSIVYEMRDGKPYFILTDFDLAIVETTSGAHTPTSKHHAGTLPSLALELLWDLAGRTHEGIPVFHRLRHEFESLFWTSVRCMLTMEPVDDELKSKIREEVMLWETGTFHDIASHKFFLLEDFVLFSQLPFTPKFLHLRDPLARWAELIRNGKQVLRSHARQLWFNPTAASLIDLETLNGCITRDSIKAVLASEDRTV